LCHHIRNTEGYSSDQKTHTGRPLHEQANDSANRRRQIVAAVRAGSSFRAVARTFAVGVATVASWVHRAGKRRLDRVDWTDRPKTPRHTQRTASAVEGQVLQLRRELTASDLGSCGAWAIREALLERGVTPLPSLRTVNRILARHGAFDGRRRTRRPPPPLGWYLPEVARRQAELDSFDVVEGLAMQGGHRVEVLNGVSLHGGLVASWPGAAPVRAVDVVESLLEHWRAFGLPGYAQFDNDPIFQGSHFVRDALGRVSRLCLALAVVPVFTPPRETGFQAAVESFNGWWQMRVWARCRPATLEAVADRSGRYVQAVRQQRAVRIEAAPSRRPFPTGWEFDVHAVPRGRLIFLRRTDEQGRVEVLGHRWRVAESWPHRLVRAEVDLDRARLRFYALRRRDPLAQPLLHEEPYQLPRRRFRG
jgi:putative transposase